MARKPVKLERDRADWASALLAGLVAAFGLTALRCGGGGSPAGSFATPSSSTTGVVTTSINDPPVCMAPNGLFTHVWVTITKVQANLSADAGPTDSGWVTLVDLTQNPKQVDVLSLASTTCVLTQLGSTTGLAPGKYQQIRVILLANNAAGAIPSPNQCGQSGFNCVALAGGVTATLNLSSEAQTGIKIPPGQIDGGGINLQAGQSADINIDFNACDSIIQQGNGQFRLKPTLHAGEVAVNANSINGRVVDSVTNKPVAAAMVLVEQPDSNNVDRIVEEAVTGSDGTFIFCPLPAGSYDVVATASVSPAVGVVNTYNATVTLKVPLGTDVGDIPIIPEQPGSSVLPATISGQVTTMGSGNTATSADVSLSALQQISSPGSAVTMVTVPAFAGSTPAVTTGGGTTCPLNADCATYSLLVPASNPSVGIFSSSGTRYASPGPGNVLYVIDVEAFVPNGTNTPDCTPPVLTASSNASGNPLAVAPGSTVTAHTLAFSGCQ